MKEALLRGFHGLNGPNGQNLFNGIRILYEDNHLLVVEKPPGVLSQGDRTGDEDISVILKKYLKDKYKKPGNVYLGHVHRLDRPVGGAMVFGKTSKAASRLCGQMREGKFTKEYLAIVEGILTEKSGTFVHYLKKNERKNTVSVSDRVGGGSARAELSYTVLSEKEDLSLVKVSLKTGRPHQIRAQFSHSGFPLLGDSKYGTTDEKAQVALWSYRVGFIHPTKNSEMSLICPPPRAYPWNIF